MEKKMQIIFLTAALVGWVGLYGCYGSRVVAGDTPYYEGKQKGPPPWAPAHGYRAKHQYRYYPSSSVYFDVGRVLYFYYCGDRWCVSGSLPGGFQIDWDEYVTLEMDTDTPYEFHREVVRRYPPGQLKKMNRVK
jgi:hypothetical protein